MIKFILLLFVLSCTSKAPTIRSSYQLSTVDNFLISNLYVDPVKIASKDSKVEIKYDLVIKNLKKSQRKVNLSKSMIGNKYSAIPFDCHSYLGKEKAFTVEAEETFKVECQGTISKKFVPFGDSKLDILISLEKDYIGFKYLVRAEDF